MPILHKSSKFQTYSYFIIFPIIICVTSYFILQLIIAGQFSIFTTLMLLIFVYGLITSADSLYRLRYIEVTEDNIIVKKFSGDETIEYSSIEGVYNLINNKGNSLIIWYKDSKTNNSRSIFVRPDEKNPRSEMGFPLFSYKNVELEITKYIRERAVKANPEYDTTIKPRWFLFGIK